MRAARTVGAGAGSDRPLLSRVSLLPAQAGSPGRDCRALPTEVATREASACAEPGHASRHLPSVGPRETPHVFNTHVRHWVWRPRPCTGPHRRGSSPAWTLHLLPSPAQASVPPALAQAPVCVVTGSPFDCKDTEVGRCCPCSRPARGVSRCRALVPAHVLAVSPQGGGEDRDLVPIGRASETAVRTKDSTGESRAQVRGAARTARSAPPSVGACVRDRCACQGAGRWAHESPAHCAVRQGQVLTCTSWSVCSWSLFFTCHSPGQGPAPCREGVGQPRSWASG